MRWLWIAAVALLAGLAMALLISTRQESAAPQLDVAAPAPIDAASAPVAERRDAARDGRTLAGPEARGLATPDARGVPEEVLDDVRGSGPTQAPWTGAALALLRTLHTVETSEVACYAAGCTERAVFASEDEAADEIAAWQSSSAYVAWTGGAMLTPAASRPDGRVVIVVVLYPPK